MIKHVVLFKLKNFDSEAEKEEALNKFKTMLLALENHIPELKYIEVGQHFLIDSPSFDLCLITHFESLTDLDAYQVHPEHLKVGQFVKQISVNRAAVDYEF
ncbi:MAG TPA: Dabb family protein [Prolixibacteraceae bacterium]|nr:Dabb family protein [Prolixibacteraceae bacterium]